MTFCGIDVGTSAVRVKIVSEDGRVICSASTPLAPPRVNGPRREQEAESWWQVTCETTRRAVKNLDGASIDAVAVDATSGTIVFTDEELRPLGPGLMYNDNRASGYGARINDAAGPFLKTHGYRFKDNFSLSRIVWASENDPCFKDARRVMHQGDYINARLAGKVTGTDWSTALKSGCDLHLSQWPAFLSDELNLPVEILPTPVVAPGMLIGEISKTAERQSGLPAGAKLVAGASDGMASLLASGVATPGEFNTSLGSTIIVKGVAERILDDPEGMIYCHRHPDGSWLPGGASNAGCSAINLAFAPAPETRKETLGALDLVADRFLPSSTLVYPLGDATEERFPFRKNDIQEMIIGGTGSQEERYAAYVQGISFVERWCYEKLESLGAPVKRIFSTGGGSSSTMWLQVRADVLQHPLTVPKEPEAAFGAAILAASQESNTVQESVRNMVSFKKTICPGSRNFDVEYRKFQDTWVEHWGLQPV